MKNIHYILIYIITSMGIISSILINRRSYQDSWILCDILIPVLLYMLVFSIAVVFISSNKVVALICSSFVLIMTLTPALKYDLFYGIPDVMFHYRFLTDLIASGHTPSGYEYTGVSGLHIFIGLFYLLLGLLPNAGMKFAVGIAYSFFPLATYFVSNKLVSDENLVKFTVISSAFLLVDSYFLTGTIFALPFLFLASLTPMVCHFQCRSSKGRYIFLNLIILFGLLISHTITSLLFLLFLAGSIAILPVSDKIFSWGEREINSRMRSMLIFSAVLFIAWWLYEAHFLLYTFIKNSFNLITVEHYNKTPVPSRFFTIPLMAKLKIFSIYHMKDALMSSFSLMGLFIFLRNRNDIGRARIFYAYLGSILLPIIFMIIFELVKGYGNLEYYRFIYYGIIFAPFFVGISLSRLEHAVGSHGTRARLKSPAMAFIIFIILTLSSIQFFPCQPIVPAANTVFKDLPEGEPLMYFTSANTIYQKDMISFASDYSQKDARISADVTTRLQLDAFFNRPTHDLREVSIYLSPLISKEDTWWSLLLLHRNGKAGPLGERAEDRTRSSIESIRNGDDQDMIYDNGESFIIQRDLFRQP